MIIDVQKVIFVGSKDDRDAFFTRAQREGVVEFIHSKQAKKGEMPKELQDTLKAIKILKKQPVTEQIDEAPDIDFDELSHETLQTKELHDALEEKRRYLEAEIARIHPLGDFSLDKIRQIATETGLRFRFFAAKTAKRDKVFIPETLHYISSEYGMDYYIGISKTEIEASDLFEVHVEQSLGTLLEELQTVESEYAIVHEKLKELAAYLDLLKQHLINQSNAFNIIHVIDGSEKALDEMLFYVEAWIPKNKISLIGKFTRGLAVYSDVIAVENTDVIPTYMENHGLAAVGEDLVHIYDTPAITDKDPSLWVVWAFAFFFAMIVSDAGYGLIYLTIALIIRWRSKNLQGFAKRLLSMMTMISIFIVGWGVLTGSYFGIEFAPNSVVNKVSLLKVAAVQKAEYHIQHKDEIYQFWIKKYPKLSSVTSGEKFLELGEKINAEGKVKYEINDEFNDSILLEFSILVGIIHICLSLARNLRTHWAGLGWMFCIVGGYLFFPSMLKGTTIINFFGLISKTNADYFGIQLLIGGIILAMILALIQHRLGGIGEVTQGLQIFADILSYLRLYALGLAGMILASTFNDIGERVGYAVGWLIILAGHTINMSLGIMGGTIHGLRLNFLEWYHYCFVGGGKLFNPLKLLKRSST